MKQKDCQTQKVRLRLALNRVLLVFSVLLYLNSQKIANYNTTIDEAWFIWKIILMLVLTMLVFSLKSEVVKLVTALGYKIIIYTLINYFIDVYLNEKDWSLNDYLTVSIVVIEGLIFKYKKMKNENK